MSRNTSDHRSVRISRERLDRIAAHLSARLALLGGDQTGFKADIPGWISAAIDEKLARNLADVPPAHGAEVRPDDPGHHDDPGPQAAKDPENDPGPQAAKDPNYEVFEGVRIRVGVTKPRAGYIHWRSRRHVVAEALEIDIPAEVIHHAGLMTENLKPTMLGWKRAEKLIAQVKDAQAAGKDPSPLWAPIHGSTLAKTTVRNYLEAK